MPTPSNKRMHLRVSTPTTFSSSLTKQEEYRIQLRLLRRVDSLPVSFVDSLSLETQRIPVDHYTELARLKLISGGPNQLLEIPVTLAAHHELTYSGRKNRYVSMAENLPTSWSTY